jgi:hypothetical protein
MRLGSKPGAGSTSVANPERAAHLVAKNDVYVELVQMLQGLPRIEDANWKWVPEPLCHRR